MNSDMNDAQRSAAQETVPAALLDIHQRLLEDGAAWRDELPLGATRSTQTGVEPFVSHRSTAKQQAHDGLLALPPVISRRDAGLIRGLVASAAIIVVVGLLAALFATFARGRNDRHLLATPTPGPLASWSVAPHLATEPVPPIIAPSDPAVVYEAGIISDGTGPISADTPRVFRRSDDAGATWHDLPVPDGGLGPYTLDSLALWVDPANAENVIATLSRELPEQGQQDCPTNRASVAFARQVGASASTPASGPQSCQLQYCSVDGGEHWSEMRFPVPGAISNSDIVFSDVVAHRRLRQLQSQGTRLYTAIHYLGVENVTRILVSQDRGATWNLADVGLYGSDRGICDFLAAPDSTTLYATTGASACGQDFPSASVTLWRSDDAGVHWNRLGQLPGNFGQLVGAFKSAGHADFTLYIITVPTRGRGYTQAWASEDGGREWNAAPDPGTVMSGKMFLSEAHDGSLVVITPPSFSVVESTPATLTPPATRTASSGASPKDYAIMAWRPGQASWRPIAQPLLTEADIFHHQIVDTVESYTANGERTLWAAIASRNANGDGMIYGVRMARLT
jgi:hypothetical protein